MKTKFTNATIVTVNDNFDVLKNATLVVENGTIVFLGTKEPSGTYDKVINCQGNIIMPGFVNTHSHAAMTLFRGLGDEVVFEEWWKNYMLPKEKLLTKEDIEKGVTIAVKEMQQNGITTFYDCYFHSDVTIEVCKKLGMRVGVAFGAISGNDQLTMESLEEQLKQLKKHDHVIPFLYAHSTYSCDEYQFGILLAMAKKHNLVFCTHVSETLNEVGVCHNKHGVTPVGLLENYGMLEVPCLLAHCVHCDKDDVNILKNYDVTIAHNPASNLKLGSGIASLHSFLKQNLNVSLGTDGAASNNSLDMFKEMYLAANLQYGILNNPKAVTAKQAIQMATVNGAKALKQTNFGKLDVGYLADLIMLDAAQPNMQPNDNAVSNIVFSANPSNVLLTMMNGNIVYQK